ncbi:MAG: hypothetical protein A3E87_09620 [Gammaproteobacteria bacterium RIFCSPHIGHO2_12_FULL_35_23]|nr:MAG: hypothetical protein A3E87_09620 [Gammaproteobacteria bacterium RIFCSPHIGHO2_12_FULL_35_23]
MQDLYKKQAKRNMITQQIRAWDVLNDDILDLMNSVPREIFIPKGYEHLAYADINTPIGNGQVMLAPKVIGKILAALVIIPTETVLEIGTGSGYLTSLLAKQSNHVYSIEIDPEKKRLAQINLKRLGIENISLMTGDAAKGWSPNAPYDVIITTGSFPKLPTTLQKQLNIGGRIFAIIGSEPNMQALLLTKLAENSWEEKCLFETSAPRLINVNESIPFIF